MLFDFIYGRGFNCVAWYYIWMWIYLPFSGQLSNTTEIELLETKLDPYIWFTALLSEFFSKIKAVLT